MAGIGFELKKLFKKNSVISKLRGSSYAAMTTIGPLVMVIGTLFLMYFFLGYADILFASKELLASTLLYIFIFSLCGTAPLNSVLSRYLSDKIYENKEEDIIPAFYSGMTVNAVFSSIVGAVFCLWEYFVGNVDAIFVFVSFLAYIGLTFIFYIMLYITAIKEYKKITFSFIAGLSVALGLAVLMVKVFGVNVELSVITGFATGFVIIALCLYGLVRSFFRVNSRNYGEVFSYFKHHWRLILTNTFYIFGLYVHIFIFWTTPERIVVVNSFITAPAYDMATCIGMFINISMMVIFIVEVETNFHEKYQNYCQTLMGGTGVDIRYAKNEMFRSIKNELFFTFQLQVIFTVVLFTICLIVLPAISIGGRIIQMLPTLAVAYFIVFLMYDLIIFIYYFNNYTKSMITCIIFFSVTFAGTLISCRLDPPLYGLGLLAGAFAGFSYAFFSIRSIEKNLDHMIFCKGNIVNMVVSKKTGHTLYENKPIKPIDSQLT